jgi:hypothetical protein
MKVPALLSAGVVVLPGALAGPYGDGSEYRVRISNIWKDETGYVCRNEGYVKVRFGLSRLEYDS